MVVAIDGSNIRAGGGITHLMECLSVLSPEQFGIERVYLYGGDELLSAVGNFVWLEKCSPHGLRGGGGRRYLWRQFHLNGMVSSNADVLLVPGGSYSGGFRPFVALAQNVLPFDVVAKALEGLTAKRLRLQILSRIQRKTFRRASGLIYMSAISKRHIELETNFEHPQSRVIYHGTRPSFFEATRDRISDFGYSAGRPFRLLYVSTLEPYKHQSTVVQAVVRLNAIGIPVHLDLVGPGDKGDCTNLAREISRSDPERRYIRYHGPLPYSELSAIYLKGDAFVFASSCETFGIILLEAMASGLPLICSNRSAMPEVVGDAGLYFDPLSVDSLVRSIRCVWENPSVRRSLVFRGRTKACEYSWARCASQTFGFIRDVHVLHGNAKTKK